MGLFFNSIGDVKKEDGEYYAYGWCDSCGGTGWRAILSPKFEPVKPKSECSWCKGKGKRWYGGIKNTDELKDLFLEIGFRTIRIYPFQKEPPTKTAHYAEPVRKNCDSEVTCNHNWRFSHKGADKNYPRIHYTCSRCGKGGVQENSGDPIVEI